MALLPRKYTLFLAWRYLTRRLLSMIAVFALGAAVWALVLMPSVMSGFQEEFHRRLRGTLSDLTVWSARPFTLPDDPAIETYLEGLPNVVAAAPYLENPALNKRVDKIDYCFLRGIDPTKEAEVSVFRTYFISPRDAFLQLEDFDLRSAEEQENLQLIADTLSAEVDVDAVFRQLVAGHPDDPELPAIAVGIYFAKSYPGGLMIGDTVRLTTASEEGEVAQDQAFRVVGLFRTGHHDTDRRVLYMSLPVMQRFIKVEGKVSGYSLKLKDHQQAHLTKDALAHGIRNAAIEPIPLPALEGYYIKTWEERNENLLRAVQMEKLLIRLITMMIVVAASASIFLVLFMSVHTKVRELGILRAIGATRSGVLALFVGQGLAIALLAMTVGIGAGIVTGAYINELADLIHRTTGWHPFPPDIYYIEEIPVRFVPAEMAVNFLATLLLGSIAAFVPGLMAALRPPLKSIRYE